MILAFSNWLMLCFLVTSPGSSFSSFDAASVCLSQEEYELFLNINRYRNSKGLASVELSGALTYVAQIHARDLQEHYDHGKRCNLHSWSNHGPWKSCCYTDDHKKAACMWYKPNELTGFEGIGYEMVFYSTYPGDVSNMAQGALNGWKNSAKHDEMIVHKGMWKQISWRTIGIGIFENYAVVWFSDSPDPGPLPLLCK